MTLDYTEQVMTQNHRFIGIKALKGEELNRDKGDGGDRSASC